MDLAGAVLQLGEGFSVLPFELRPAAGAEGSVDLGSDGGAVPDVSGGQKRRDSGGQKRRAAGSGEAGLQA